MESGIPMVVGQGRGSARTIALVQQLSQLAQESEVIEFKCNHKKPDDIGEYISALANAAALLGAPRAYVVWGIADEDHEIVGTRFSPARTRKGNEPLETWLLQMLRPRIDFRFHEATVDGKAVVLLEVEPASGQPVAFCNTEYIRVGSSKRKLREYPEKERTLWRSFDRLTFERRSAAEGATGDEVVSLLNCPAYFDLVRLPLPAGRVPQLERLCAEGIIRSTEAGRYDITNLGAVALARDLRDFGRLGRKAVRVIQYLGPGRHHASKEHEMHAGYAVGFREMMAYVNGILPARETVGSALRQTTFTFPETAVRELVANAIIHQDFSVRGAGPMVEIFDRRIEVTNPGESLVKPERFIDGAPTSRNEMLASLMRRFGFCEERGSGIDKVIIAVELARLPPPDFRVLPGSTRTVLFAWKELKEMDRLERLRAVYQHACLRYVLDDYLTNTSLRERFGLKEKSRASVSRIIRDAVNEGAIVPFDVKSSPKYMKYVPFWAA